MRRWQRGLFVVLAVVVGAATGVVLFSTVGPIPLRPTASGDPTSSGMPSSDPTSHDTASTPAPKRLVTPTPAPDPSAPPFTELALLQPENLDEHNWHETQLGETWDWLPRRQITSCAQMSPTDGQPVEAYAATYEGRVTTAAEIVVRYPHESAAREAMQRLSDRIDACADSPQDQPQLEAESISPPREEDAIEVVLWQTTAAEGEAQGVVGIARADDRLAFLSLLSPKPGSTEVLDPLESTYVDALYVYAGRRLV